MADKNNKAAAKKQGPKKPNFFVATFGELKQVSWPTFADTMKRLGAVLAITVIFLVILMCIDLLLNFIYTNLFQAGFGDREILTAEQIAALIVGGVLVIAAIAGVIAYKVIKSKSNNDEIR